MGRLRLSQLLPNDERGVRFLKVWELNYNYDGNDDEFPPTWALLHHVEVKIECKSWLFVIAFLPDNDNVIRQ